MAHLAARGVDCVVIGGYAAIAHGSAQQTNDIDICFAPDEQNLRALGEALVELHPRLRGVGEDVPSGGPRVATRTGSRSRSSRRSSG